ncbi:MAG: hemolysin family protein, partial [Gemmatimonadetes bacterium]|nr:hemolysin family protein [Gemmatimonadota bacterium]
MEPPQVVDLSSVAVDLSSVAYAALGGAISLVWLFLVASYETTFAILSKSVLEKMAESGVSHTRAMLRIYEPRLRLRLMTRLGEAIGVTVLALFLFFLVETLLLPYALSSYISVAVALFGALGLFMIVATPRRIRFDEEGDEARIPVVALAYAPVHALLLPLTNLLELLSSFDYSDEDFRAEKEEELRSIVEAEGESGVLEESEREMIESVFGFHDRIVREVMVPRVDMVAIDQSASLQDLLDLIRDKGHSRLPIYRESLDHIQGLVYAKDLLQILVSWPEVDLATPIDQLLTSQQKGDLRFTHEPYYIPETKKIDVLLNDLRANRIRLAIVLDEYGGTAGLVTTEDLVEEIVGEIQDEYDEEEELHHWQVPGEVLIANARIDIDDLNELLSTDLPRSGFETLGGFIYDHLGSIPAEGLVFTVNHLELDILKVEGQRISQVKLRRLTP